MYPRRLLDVRYAAISAASLLLLAAGCEVARAPHPPPAVQQASPARTHTPVAAPDVGDLSAKWADSASCSPDQARGTPDLVASRAPTGDPATRAEADYLSAKRAYTACLVTDQARRMPDSMLSVREAAALHDLTGRLRSILGPFQAEGFTDSGAINLQTLLPGYVESGDVDGIAYRSRDSTTVLATTRTLLAAWLQSTRLIDTTTSRDSMSVLASPVVFTKAFPEDAAVIPYANIPVDRAAQSGVVAAMLVMRAQDVGPGTPNEVMVSVVRGNRAYLAAAHARALIAPMAACLSRSDAALLRCYEEHASADPRFARLVQQVDSIVKRLPTQ